MSLSPGCVRRRMRSHRSSISASGLAVTAAISKHLRFEIDRRVLARRVPLFFSALARRVVAFDFFGDASRDVIVERGCDGTRYFFVWSSFDDLQLWLCVILWLIACLFLI